MSFGINTDGLHRIDNYDAAVKLFKETKPWRGYSDYDGRSLGPRTKKHMNIRMTHNDSVACRLYRTDVVVFNKDGSITLTPYVSNSTNAFSSAIMPSGIRMHDRVVWVGDGYYWADAGEKMNRGYRVKHVATFRPTPEGEYPWTPEEGETETFGKVVINKERAKAALKEYNYKDFAVWLNMAQHMIKKPEIVGSNWSHRSFGHKNHPYFDVAQVILLLENRGQWPDIVRNYLYGTASHLLSQIREWVYKKHKCYDTIELPYVTGWRELRNIESSRR